MKTDKEYLTFLRDLKQSILKSRYIAMRLANREQLILYYATGLKLSKKVAEEKWGAKVIQQLADDLQNELPGLKGLSRRNLMKMKQFYEAYATFSIVPLTTAQIAPSASAWAKGFPLSAINTESRSTAKIIGLIYCFLIALDQLEIFYNKFDSVIISPKEKAGFVADLVKLNLENKLI